MHFHALYFLTSFLYEPSLLSVLCTSPRLVLSSRLLSSPEFLLLPLAYLLFSRLSPYSELLRESCVSHAPCARLLRPTSSPLAARFAPSVAPDLYLADAADPQWRAYRSSLPPLLLFAAFSLLCSRLLPRALPRLTRPRAHACLGLGFLLYLHGAGAFFPLCLLLLHHLLPPLLPRLLPSLPPPQATFVGLALLFALTVLLKDPLLLQVSFSDLSPHLAFLDGREYQGE